MANLESGTVSVDEAREKIDVIARDIEKALEISSRVVKTLEDLSETNNLNPVEQAAAGSKNVDTLLGSTPDVMAKIKKDENAWVEEFNRINGMQADI